MAVPVEITKKIRMKPKEPAILKHKQRTSEATESYGESGKRRYLPHEATLDDYHVDEIHLLKNILRIDLDSIDKLIYQLECDTERIESEITTQFEQSETDRNIHSDISTATINQEDNKPSITLHHASTKTPKQDKDTRQNTSDKHNDRYNKQERQTDNKETSAEPSTRRQQGKEQRKKKRQNIQNENRRSKRRENTDNNTEQQQKRERNSNQRTQYRDNIATHDDPTLSFHLHDKEVEPASEIDRGSDLTTAQQLTEKHNLQSKTLRPSPKEGVGASS